MSVSCLRTPEEPVLYLPLEKSEPLADRLRRSRSGPQMILPHGDNFEYLMTFHRHFSDLFPCCALRKWQHYNNFLTTGLFGSLNFRFLLLFFSHVCCQQPTHFFCVHGGTCVEFVAVFKVDVTGCKWHPGMVTIKF